jgi:NADP-dependent 3-hydroxy acid dehydrogenase YdfG
MSTLGSNVDTPRGAVLITGAASGIGRAIARRLAPTRTLVLTSRSEDRLQSLANELGAVAIAGDITCPETMTRCLGAAGTFSGVIANAGIMPIAPIGDALIEDWNSTVQVNVMGVLRAVHAILPRLTHGGDVVVVSSVAGQIAFPSAAVYSATKAAVSMFAQGLRGETAAAMKHGGPAIRVTTILPGAVDTSLTESIGHDATRQGTQKYYQDLPHVLEPNDVAQAVAFAMEQPQRVSINEIVIRPTGMAR